MNFRIAPWLVLVVVIVLSLACESQPIPTAMPAILKGATATGNTPTVRQGSGPTPAPPRPLTVIEDNVVLRETPSFISRVVKSAPKGTILRAYAGNREEAEGTFWVFLTDPEGNRGWVPEGAAKYQPAPAVRATVVVQPSPTPRPGPQPKTTAIVVSTVVVPSKSSLRETDLVNKAWIKQGSCNTRFLDKMELDQQSKTIRGARSDGPYTFNYSVYDGQLEITSMGSSILLRGYVAGNTMNVEIDVNDWSGPFGKPPGIKVEKCTYKAN